MNIVDMHDPFYVQHMRVSNAFVGKSRLEVFRSFCDNRKVLHIGCAGFPTADYPNSIHVQLAPYCSTLDGYDEHMESYPILASLVNNGKFVNSLEDAKNEYYDVILLSEVLEHVGDPKAFLEKISEIPFDRIIITVPDLFQCFNKHFGWGRQGDEFIEIVHPDHNFWFSPYTISNLVNKYTGWEIEELGWFNNISLLLSCRSRKFGAVWP